ncbi:hypothetical protein BDV95DRAFT_606537 [Massariosphaeria phaeospora]|uniref:Uncharacterized protein n=1 Tax=Massariosphaeria phaeospora TaxID=100035 RepID=A0A7C8IFU9_9PLEO|nr:hypothetical protein BDV95DRAFT_606537 [Massariosphaeria phaeospora]
MDSAASSSDSFELMKKLVHRGIRPITKALGLVERPQKQPDKKTRGDLQFDHSGMKQLAAEIMKISKSLPHDIEQIENAARDPDYFKERLKELMNKVGKKIWGQHGDRAHLAQVDAESDYK